MERREKRETFVIAGDVEGRHDHRYVDPREPALWEAEDEQRLERLRSPNGDPYRAEHLRDIGEAGLQCLYRRDKLDSDELDRLLGELFATEPDPLD